MGSVLQPRARTIRGLFFFFFFFIYNRTSCEARSSETFSFGFRKACPTGLRMAAMGFTGAAGGAVAGAVVGGPVGAAVGGVAGGVIGGEAILELPGQRRSPLDPACRAIRGPRSLLETTTPARALRGSTSIPANRSAAARIVDLEGGARYSAPPSPRVRRCAKRTPASRVWEFVMAQLLTAQVVGITGADPLFARIRQEAEEAARREPELGLSSPSTFSTTIRSKARCRIGSPHGWIIATCRPR